MTGQTRSREPLAANRGVRSNAGAARGFTLVEMLVTVAIIGILVAVALGALRAARESARHIKTKSTIKKLDTIVMEQYGSYRTRRIGLSYSQIQTIAQDRGYWNPSTDPTIPFAAMNRVRVDATRDLMRMEMPERWSDVTHPVGLGTTLSGITQPALSRAYRRCHYAAKQKLIAAGLPQDPSPPRLLSTEPLRGTVEDLINRYASAECLYMIVAMAGGPDARGQLRDSEIGDADGDGLPEFHDAWGNPILFLRWAPGLADSEFQAQVYFLDGTLDPPTYVRDGEAARQAALEDHDPFDSCNVLSEAYRLVPFIYSAGPDGIYDIGREGAYYFGHRMDSFTFNRATDPYNGAGVPVDGRNESVTAMDPPGRADDPSCGPKRTPNSIDHHDNIHSHGLEAK